jgi:hypothetical protein
MSEGNRDGGQSCRGMRNTDLPNGFQVPRRAPAVTWIRVIESRGRARCNNDLSMTTGD